MKHAKTNRFKFAPEIAAEFIKATGLNICTMAVRRYLQKHDVKSYVAVPKPYLSRENMRARMKWAKKHNNRAMRKRWDKI